MNYKLIVLLLFIFSSVSSISSSPYKHYKIEDLCSTNPLKIGFDLLTVNKPEIRLDEFQNSGAVVRQSWKSSALKKFNGCTFKVVVQEDRRNLLNPSKVGIYAFIHRLNLRKTKYTYRTNDECIDFVQFANGDRSKGTGQMCGKYISDGGYHTEDRNHWFASNDREIRVLLDLNKYVQLDHDFSPLDLVIVFTVFTSNCNSSTMIECAPDQCISKAFTDDTFINCPPISCQDERKCYTDVLIEQAQRPSGLNGTNIAISAITSLIITMTAVFCIYVCFKYRWCRKNSLTNSSGRRNGDDGDLAVGAINNRRGPPGQRIIETEYSSINADRRASSTTGPTTSAGTDGGNSHSAHPTAPILDDDKDKPPSYDSLFNNKMINNETNVGNTQQLPNNQ